MVKFLGLVSMINETVYKTEPVLIGLGRRKFSESSKLFYQLDNIWYYWIEILF